jgi:hypothetical protein
MPNPNWVYYVDRRTPAATKIQRAWRRRQSRVWVGTSTLVRPRVNWHTLPPEIKRKIIDDLRPVPGAPPSRHRMTSFNDYHAAVDALKIGGRGRRRRG